MKPLVVAVIFIWSVAALAVASEPQRLKLVSLANFPPYAWEKNGEPVGIDVDIVHELGRRTGLIFVILSLPTQRALMMVPTAWSRT